MLPVKQAHAWKKWMRVVGCGGKAEKSLENGVLDEVRTNWRHFTIRKEGHWRQTDNTDRLRYTRSHYADTQTQLKPCQCTNSDKLVGEGRRRNKVLSVFAEYGDTCSAFVKTIVIRTGVSKGATLTYETFLKKKNHETTT